MKALSLDSFGVGPRLTLIFAVLMTLILGGNALLIWQFHLASLQTNRLTGMSEQLVTVLRLHENLLSFHQRLDELAQTKDAPQLKAEADRLRLGLLEQTERTRAAIAQLSSEAPLDTAFSPTLRAIEITLPSQLEVITGLAEAGDWRAVQLRISNELKPLEMQTSALVQSIGQEVSGELTEAVSNMKRLRARIVFIVPTTGALTFLIALFFGWAITRRILELRFEERLAERTRIAQELHDTLLQDFQAMILRFHNISRRLVSGDPNRLEMDEGLRLADKVLAEGRNRIRDIRADTKALNELSEAFADCGNELSHLRPVSFNVKVTGEQIGIGPIVRDEIYRIGREAVANAFTHSECSKIEIELAYHLREFKMTIRDDGKGIDPAFLNGGGKPGHWGIHNMRDRARKIGASLEFTSMPNAGTTLKLKVPVRFLKQS
jgi:signal transduction histidine kinase